jgi:hypothetical protein
MTKKQTLNDMTYVNVDDGKYTVILGDNNLRALRYGEEWRDCCGDNLIFYLASELDEARKEINRLQRIVLEKLEDEK